MLQSWIGEPLQKRTLVAREVGPRWNRQGRRDLLIHEALNEADEVRIGHHVGDGFVTREIAEVGERRVAGVQKAQLHQLIRGPTSATSSAPASSKRGRPLLKRSSITHCVNGSVITGQASETPRRSAIAARSASVVAGTIRSTMVEGNAISSSTQRPRSGSRKRANWARTRPTVWPFSGRLSQHRTVKGATPLARRRRKASTRLPGALRARSGAARSVAMSG